MQKTLRLLSLLLTLSMLSACQLFALSAGFRPDQQMEARIRGDQSISPSADLLAIDLLALDQSVIDYLDTHIDPALQNWEIVDRLQQILFSEEFLNIQYDDTANFTASQTFAERRANCLSLVNLYIGMARHLGLNVQYQTIQIRPIWNRKGELLVLSEHINALGRLGPSNQYIVDFTPEVRLQQQTAKVISDRQAKALFFNNLGVEHLLAGDFDRSLEHFRFALAIDPSLAMAWNNIGSVLGRLDEPELSEYSYLKASALDRNSASAANNLARIYYDRGEYAKSERYRRAVLSYNRRNPYYHYMLGNIAYEENNYDAALGHFQEAIRRGDQEPDFYMALGMTFRELGDEKAFSDLSQLSIAMRELGDQTYRPTQNRVRRVESRSILRMTGSGISIRVVD